VLQFIFGLPLSGKTETILQKAKELSENGGKSVIIVPEQYTFETEKRVLNTLGNSFALNVQVLSFSRLYDEIFNKIGGMSSQLLGDSDKVIFMNKALKQVSVDLKLWGKYAKSLFFARTMLDTVGEFKINGITASDLENAAQKAESQNLKQKLIELKLIIETYDALISERYIDPADKLAKVYESLLDYKYFENKTVFFDGFKGFTGQQFKIIDRVFSQAENVYIALTNDLSCNREYDVFTNIRLATKKIEKYAKRHNVKINEHIFLSQSYYKSQDMFNIERILSDNKPTHESDGTVTICESNTIYDEADFVASTIRKLVRTKGYRYRDFAIIVRDSEKYAQAVEYACNKNNVECFFDKKIPLLSFPLSIAALSAIKALDFSTENILRFHKSGIGVLSIEEISKLENYAYLWNINGKTWLDDWDMDTRGFVDKEMTDEIKEEICHLNSLRKKAILPIIEFKKNFKDNATDMSRALITLFEQCNATESLKTLSLEYGDKETFSADVLRQSYDSFMDVLDSIVKCFSAQSLTTKEYYDALNLALSLKEIGIIPQMLDQVIYGQADLILLSAPKVVFVLGANQGVFPRYSNNSSVFAIKERKALINLDIQIADNEIYSAIDENYLIYCKLSSAVEKLYISYAKQTLKGEELTPSAFVTVISESLKCNKVYAPYDHLNSQNAPETLASAYSELCRRFNNEQDSATLKTAIETASNSDFIKSVESFAVSNEKSITRQNAKKLYGDNLYLSASKFDVFNHCKFAYFCKYGLKIQKMQPADFDAMQRGTIVHYVLEKIIDKYRQNIKDLSGEQLDELCDFYIDEYLDSVTGYRSVETARHRFLVSKISRTLKEVIRQIAKEFAQSDFVPTDFELKIGGKDGLPLEFLYDEGKIIINGSIDRVDRYDAYIRIVDYKTGTKTFKLPDILYGLNLQMLIYLYALVRGQNNDESNAAGILYMPSKRDLNNDGLAMNGLLKGDKDLILAMEKENKGEFVPQISFNKDGSLSKKRASFITEQEFSKIFDHIEQIMKKTGNSIANGDICVNPIDGRETNACKYCDFKAVCGIENKVPFRVPVMSNTEIFEAIDREGENNGI